MSVSHLTRIIWHWSAGTYEFSDSDYEHYHFSIDGDGHVHAGEHTPEDNLDTSDDDYAAHVKSYNTGSIGVAICAMAGAIEAPFYAGEYPIKSSQIDALIRQTSELCKKYGITPSRTTTLSHAEVEPSLGVSQDGKWDITWLPTMKAVNNPINVGDHLRKMLVDYMAGAQSTSGGGSEDYAELERRISAIEEWIKSY